VKVLVVSCDTGGGHNAAAHAVCEDLEAHGHVATFLELYDLRSHRATRRASGLYVWSTRHPSVFGGTYRIGDSFNRHVNHRSPVYYHNRRSSGLLETAIAEGGYQAVVATHLFAAEALTALRIHGRAPLPLVGVETDYTCIPFWNETELDRYLIPHADCLADFVAHRLPAERIVPCGIPVSAAFSQPRLSRGQARALLCERYGFPVQGGPPLFTIMSGSMGFGRLEDLVAELVRQGDADLVVGCGTNTAALARLRSLYGGSPRVAVEGFIDEPDLYLRAADVLLTKPGGLTSTEAAVMGVPLVHTSPIPGCEGANRAFFMEHGLSLGGRTVEEQAAAAYTLARDDGARAAMVAAQHAVVNPHAADDLRELLVRMVGERDFRRR